MASFLIEGGNRLEGEVDISGSKNAALPIMAASILNGGRVTLYNVPNIQDIHTSKEILRYLGCKVSKRSSKVTIDSNNIKRNEIPGELMKKMRSSIIFAGALIGRSKQIAFSCPGGCEIGLRPIDLHLKGFELLGARIKVEQNTIICSRDVLVGNTINLIFPSVGATENVMLASILAKGETIIVNAAKEPEIIDLQNFLNRMGADIDGAGTNIIRINGVKKLRDVSYNIMPDRIEASTFLCMGAVTKGNIIINNVKKEQMLPVLDKLKEAGNSISIEKNKIEIRAPKKLRAVNINTMPYPGFPTDMQSIISSVLCYAKGKSNITENIFENRFKYIDELKKMGAQITVNGRTAVITGVKKLNGKELVATDLRGGAAILTATLAARGQSKINKIGHILRGYENIDKKLLKIGANIKYLS